MNVRFFAGTRAQYDSLPAPRNPLGLYFCADTQELFWADRLLTDGMRVIPTMADLPTPDKAADGVVYYVTETRNGYVVPHGTTEWLQTIYAPLRKGESVVPGEEDNTVTTIGAVNDIVAKIYKDMDERIANIEIGTSGSGVKAIYFAGVPFDSHGDGTYCIDRLCALRALGFTVPDEHEAQDFEIVTKEYVDSQIAAITGANLDDFVKQEDLKDYATKEHVQALIAEAELNSQPDLNNYYTKSETDIAIKSAVNVLNVSTLATKEELQTAINNIEHPPIPTKVSELENDAGYVTAAQLFDKAKEVYSLSVVGLASGTYMTAEESVALDKLFDLGNDYPDQPAAVAYINDTLIVKVSTFTPGSNLVLETAPSIQDTAEGTYLGYYKYTFTKGGVDKDPSLWCFDNYSQVKSSTLATEQFVKDSIEALNLPETDLTNYYTKSEVEALIPDVSHFATKDEIPSIEGLATETYVDNKVAEVKVPTKVSELDNDAGYLTQHQDLSEYAKKAELPSIEGLASEDFVRSEIAKAELNGGEVTEEELDNLLANYYNKTEVDNKFKELEIPSIEGLATEEFVSSAIAGIEIPEAELYKVDFNAPNFVEATEAYKAGKVLVLINAAPDANSYAVMNYVSDKYITFTKFLTSRSEAYGAFNTYYLSVDNTWEVSKEVKLNKVEANVEGDANGELTSIRIGKEVYKLPTTDLTGYATTESVEALAADIEHDRTQFERVARVTEALRDEVTTLNAAAVTQKYEVLPFEGALISYDDTEVRVNTQHVDIDSLPPQNAGDGSSSTYYYMTFRAYAPEGATSVIEGQNDTMDTEHSDLATDAYGRKYTTIWPAIAMKSGNTWIKYGDMSNVGDRVGKYLGFYYNFHWYSEDKLIGMDKVRVILTNDSCHNDLVPDAVARRIDDKVASVNTVVSNITEQIQNIENTYVTNNYITENYVPKDQLEANYVTTEKVTEVVTNEVTTVVTEQIETKVTEVVQEKVDSGEIVITKVDTIKYDTWEV